MPRFRSVPFHSALSSLRPCALLRRGAASAARTISVVLRSLRPGGCAGGTTSGGDENIALDDGVLAAERRYFLSAPHLEHLVVSSRRVLAEEEVLRRDHRGNTTSSVRFFCCVYFCVFSCASVPQVCELSPQKYRQPPVMCPLFGRTSTGAAECTSPHDVGGVFGEAPSSIPWFKAKAWHASTRSAFQSPSVPSAGVWISCQRFRLTLFCSYLLLPTRSARHGRAPGSENDGRESHATFSGLARRAVTVVARSKEGLDRRQ